MRRRRTLNRRRLVVACIIAFVTIAAIAYLAQSASAARPSYHTAVVRSAYAVDELCGGGSMVCAHRYSPKVFYGCGRNATCWNVCYTHVEHHWYSPWKNYYRCSTGQIKWRVGFLTYYFEY